MSLITHLGNDIVLLCDFSKLAAFKDCFAHRFFNIDMLFLPHKCCCNRCMVMIGLYRSLRHRSISFFKHLAPVCINFCFRITLEDMCGKSSINITESIDIGQLHRLPVLLWSLLLLLLLGARGTLLGPVSHPRFPGSELLLTERLPVLVRCELQLHIRIAKPLKLLAPRLLFLFRLHLLYRWVVISFSGHDMTGDNRKTS